MKKIFFTGLLAGVFLFIISYGGLYLSVKFFPNFFAAYNNPLFNSDGSRDVLFYTHAFVISMALSWFWDRFKVLFKGIAIVRGLEFGFVYAMIALLPVMWITFSTMDVTVVMVLSWLGYGFIQAVVAGTIFAYFNP
jgi:hypothetical protein